MEIVKQEVQKEKEEWNDEKELISKLQKFNSSTIKLDVGGIHYTTTLTTLQRFPESMIGAMFSGRHPLTLDEQGYYFIDRDGQYFRYILNYLRDPENFKINKTSNDFEAVNNEAIYYGIDDVMFPFKPAKDETIKPNQDSYKYSYDCCGDY
jgi:hypothetical protein